MRLLASGQSVRFDPVFAGSSSFIFTGAIPTGISSTWTRGYNVYSTNQAGSLDKEPQAVIPGAFLGQNSSYSYSNAPMLALGLSVYPTHAAAFLTANVTGSLRQTQDVQLFDTCRGQARPFQVGTYNYYQGFHPMGYYSPPYGEITTLSEAISDPADKADALSNGACANLTAKEYNELRGIVSVNVFGSENLEPFNIDVSPIATKIGSIHGPYEECPPSLTKSFYFSELLFAYGAGSFDGGVAGNVYNHNPIPTSLDYLDLQLTSRYNIARNIDGVPVITGAGETSDFLNVANYGTGYAVGKDGLNNDLLLNNKLTYNVLCNAPAMEGAMTAGINIGGTLDSLEYDPASPMNAGSLAPTFSHNPWDYWHFTYKENHDYLPFFNSQTATVVPGINPRPTSRGTQLFDPSYADSDYWWENRQCPETVDFLPWTFGATIYDCPRDYFEVPYYSAIRKFGYFGTRFSVTCNKLVRDVSHDIDNEAAPIPLYEIDRPLAVPLEYERGSMDAGGSNTNFYFDNLLAIAQREQKYTEWAASNRGYYLWANWELVRNSPAYSALLVEYPRFANIFYSLRQSYSGILKSLSHHISGSDIDIKVDPITFREDYNGYNAALSNVTSFANLDRISLDFSDTCRREITGVTGQVNYKSILSDFGFLIKSSATTINYDAYTSGVSGQEERIRTRYLNNISLGQPIDLFPTNHIAYSFDSRSSYEESTLWGRKIDGSISTSTFGPNSLQLPEVPRRYFEGVFGKRAGLTGLMELYTNYKTAHPNSLDDNPTAGSNFSLGSMFGNENCGKMGPKGAMISVLDGMMVNRTTLAASPIVNTWRALGYNEIGKLDGNFSCFTPILLQQPKNTFCKVGQSPTFRALAVDYHTIPEDKIGVRHPEIYYWAHKLKLLSKTNKYLYPMKYVWGRVHAEYTGEYMKGNYSHSRITYAGTASAWGCLENNGGPNCTFIHPTECVAGDGTTIGYNGSNKDNYSYMQGIKTADASIYFYFCIASGRYGIRGSDLLAVEADKFVLADIAFINGGGTVLSPTLSMKIDSTVSNGALQDGTAISQSFSVQGNPTFTAYHGLAQDPWTIPEEVMVRKKYIRNGGGQNIGFGFDGSDGFRGVLRSYAPETIEDTRGLKAMNHRPVDYGELIQYKLDLSDRIGGAIYGHSHLPVCSNYQMPVGRKGVRIEAQINGIAVKHKSITNPAEIGLTNPPSPMKQPPGYAYPVPNIDHVGQLYNFNYETKMGVSTSWQFHQNLGPVRRFGGYTRYTAMNSSVWGSDFVFVNDISAANQSMARYAFDYVQSNVVRPDTLAGPNCGYVEPSLGRKMLYFVEAFDRFYILCDAKAKYNVANKSFIAPGLRQGDAPFQYAWIGQPSDTYLVRKSMYGPYAYQWKVMRHNRDRLGNGVSQGFYSMGWGQKYSLMYDAAAIYGLYFKNDSNATRRATIDRIRTIRGLAFPHLSVRRMYLGRSEGPGEAYGFGDVRLPCEDDYISTQVSTVFNGGGVNVTGVDPAGFIARCAYYDISSSNLFDGGEYYCTKQGVRGGECFDPCLSIRYSHGFLPGGKRLTNMSNLSSMSSTGGTLRYKVSITQDGKHDDYVAATTTGRTVTILRGPGNTPYATALKNTTFAAQNLATPFYSLATLRRTSRVDFSISPCEQGGADHCNYNTPTLHVGGNANPSVLVNGLTSSNYNVFSSL